MLFNLKRTLVKPAMPAPKTLTPLKVCAFGLSMVTAILAAIEMFLIFELIISGIAVGSKLIEEDPFVGFFVGIFMFACMSVAVCLGVFITLWPLILKVKSFVFKISPGYCKQVLELVNEFPEVLTYVQAVNSQKSMRSLTDYDFKIINEYVKNVKTYNILKKLQAEDALQQTEDKENCLKLAML